VAARSCVHPEAFLPAVSSEATRAHPVVTWLTPGTVLGPPVSTDLLALGGKHLWMAVALEVLT
jgi:hypothetical protein